MNSLDIAKTVSSVVANASVGAVIGNAIKATTPEDLSQYKKASVFVGSMILTGMIGSHASRYAEEQVEIVDGVLKRVKIEDAPENES